MPGCINCNAQLITIENELGSYFDCPESQSIYIDYLTLKNSNIRGKFLRDSLKADRKNSYITGNICSKCQPPMSLQQDEITHGEIYTCPEYDKFWFKHDQIKLVP